MSYDVIIIGGGPAGMSALLWCHSLGLKAMLLEQAPELGGQMLQMFHRITDYPGLMADDGRELRDHFLAQLNELNLDYRTGCRLAEIGLRERRLVCNGEIIESGAIIIATGARRRRLGIPGEERFEAYGLSFSATRDHSLYAGKKVCVIGGGDSAVENSLILARICPQVTLIHRSDIFRARREWLAEARANPRITFVTHARVMAIEGDRKVERLILADMRSGEETAIETEGVFVKIGIAPNTEAFRDQLELDEEGYIKVDRRHRTSLRMIYAAGDVCRPVCLSVATAVGEGAVAAKDIAQ
ncbi:MAG: FAD-dependent oxidoreductase, partial [Blastocatellia bacterium]|nr:FAD-dependent oxidoreductase [Blastocatellia bacterium]